MTPFAAQKVPGCWSTFTCFQVVQSSDGWSWSHDNSCKWGILAAASNAGSVCHWLCGFFGLKKQAAVQEKFHRCIYVEWHECSHVSRMKTPYEWQKVNSRSWRKIRSWIFLLVTVRVGGRRNKNCGQLCGVFFGCLKFAPKRRRDVLRCRRITNNSTCSLAVAGWSLMFPVCQHVTCHRENGALSKGIWAPINTHVIQGKVYVELIISTIPRAGYQHFLYDFISENQKDIDLPTNFMGLVYLLIYHDDQLNEGTYTSPKSQAHFLKHTYLAQFMQFPLRFS